ncbi:MAG: alpha/beta hydrolase [Deltaproteobacteria bacterium]|nr:alpha/beta hydrolase [Deltaproteobacteria bacterium]
MAKSGGKGPAIVMIHNNSFQSRIFEKQILSPLGNKYQIIAFDLPGHGDSDDASQPQRTYNIPAYADIAAEIASSLGLQGVGVYGCSLGGHVGIEMMARYPLVKCLMINGAPPVGVGEAAMMEGFLPIPQNELIGKEILTPAEVGMFAQSTIGAHLECEPWMVESVARTDGRARRLVVEAFLAGTAHDQRKVVESSRVPLAVINGEHDPLVNLEYISGLDYANIWRGQPVIFQDAGHVPCWEQPDRFNLLLDEFAEEYLG